ncbi:MAG: hypothetical protein ACPIC5_05425 [Candidatus Poseidoniaceae archaeon]|jgi:hypothetical protein
MVQSVKLFVLNIRVMCDTQGGMKSMSKCGCGRSPTGMCKGWHGLSDEEYQKKLAEYKAENKED